MSDDLTNAWLEALKAGVEIQLADGSWIKAFDENGKLRVNDDPHP